MTGHQGKTPIETPLADLPTAQRGRRGSLRRFRRSQSGASAVEFGFVALPFLMLLAAMVETALMFWTSEVLEEAVSSASRSLLTGTSQTLFQGDPATKTAAFKNAVCENAPALIDCDRLKIDVRSYSSFGGATTGTSASNPVQGGALDTTGFGYNQPGAEQIVVVRAVLEYTLVFTQWSSALANIGGGKRAIVASTTFRSEPFAGT